jgi:hypothetical protein
MVRVLLVERRLLQHREPVAQVITVLTHILVLEHYFMVTAQMVPPQPA